MRLAGKLNLKAGMSLRVLGRPRDVDLEDIAAGSGDGDGVLLFVRTLAELERAGGPAVEAARKDRLAWVAYPKAGQLGTDLNRDGLARHFRGRGISPVRMVAIDGVWSAMRFRPAP